MSEKKSNHQAKLVRIEAIRVHTNADSLDLIDVGDYQVVTKKGEFHVGDVGVYVQPDSVVPQTEPFKFIWEAYVGLDGTVPEKRRRITVRKFRKEWSEGLLLNIKYFEDLNDQFVSQDQLNQSDVYRGFTVGDDVSDFLDITHYAPEEAPEPIVKLKRPKFPPKTLRGWWYFIRYYVLGGKRRQAAAVVPPPAENPGVYDVDNLRNHTDKFTFGEPVRATEKVHGSNARYIFSGDKFYVGSHFQWKHPDAKTKFHQAATDNPAIEKWCREHAGKTLYGEIVPTQTGFNYGYTDRVGFVAFDIRHSDGVKWESPYDYVTWPTEIQRVPVVYEGPYDLEVLKKLADGKSLVPGAQHLREGIVVEPVVPRKVRGMGQLKLKLVSNAFLEKDNK